MKISRHLTVAILAIITISGTTLLAGSKYLKINNFSPLLKKWDLCWQDSVEQSGFKGKSENSKLVLDTPKISGIKAGHVLFNHRIDLIPGKQYVLSFEIENSKNGIIKCFYRGHPWIPLGLSRIISIKAGTHTFYFPFTSGKIDKNSFGNITFALAELPGKVTLSNIKLEELTKIDYNLNKTWQVFTGISDTANNSKIFSAIPSSLKSSSGKTINPVAIELKNNRIDFGRLDKNFKLRDAAIIYNNFNSTENGVMQVGMGADWWMEVYINGKMIYNTMKSGNMAKISPKAHTVDIPVITGKNLLAVKVLSGSKGWSFACGEPAQGITFNKSKDWKVVDKTSALVKTGSALDLSCLVDKPAGKYGRIITGSNGSLTYENKPSATVKLLGFNRVWMLLNTSDKEFKKEAARYARAVRNQGYNLVRFEGLDGMLCKGSKADMQINPKMLDRLDYIMSEFKKEGIYTHLIMMAYWLYSENRNKEVYNRRNAYKLLIYLGGQAERKRFLYGINTLFNHKNPYTGLMWKDDPSIAIVEFYNEQELGIKHIAEDIPDAFPDAFATLKIKWQNWLKNRYGTEPIPKEFKERSFDEIPVPVKLNKTPFLANLFALFLIDISKETAQWYNKAVKQAGYPGITVQYNWSKKLGDSLVRWETMQAVDMHTYFRHPSGFAFQSCMEQDSSIATAAGYWRECNSTRIAGRPFIVSEYNHPFWNPYQYEGGLTFGAYSALQGFDALMIHANAVMLDSARHTLSFFAVGNNPISRANEFLSACLFARGDVKKSQHSIYLECSEAFIKSNSNAEKAVYPDETMLSLISGFSISFPWAKTPVGIPATKKADMTITATQGASINSHEWFSNVSSNGNGKFSISKAVDDMKEKGIISASNLTSASKGIYQSDTEEITMRINEKLLKVVTANTEAICSGSGKSEKLKNLELISSSVPGCIAVCSIDGKDIRSSSRLVLIYSTAVANEGMELSWDRRIGRKSGNARVTLMQTGKLSIKLSNDNGENMSLYALKLDGERYKKIPFKFSNGILSIDLDTAKLNGETTPFFELTTK